MAKKRRVNPGRKKRIAKSSVDGASRENATTESELAEPGNATGSPLAPKRFDVLSIGTALLAAALVYVSYHPSDSVAVEQGDALWFALLALGTATVSMAAWAWKLRRQSETRKSVDLADILAWCLAGWMMLVAFASCPPGNLRMATNEAWLWVSGAAMLSSSRRILCTLSARRALLCLATICALGVAVHGLHQEWFSLPESRAEYRENPERLLARAGIVAPAGSAERMVFENRLFDGGPSGTFALANSMAAVLLVGCLVSVGVLSLQWRDLRRWQRVAWFLVLVISLLCLWAARSRSATAACIVGIVAILLGSQLLKLRAASDANSENQQSVIKLALGGLTACLGLGAIVVAIIAAFGKREWFEQAPASIAFRLQYWRSTWQMVCERPLWGAGPGNFQAIYQRYREPSAHEQIADPHNWFFETLASGGFLAAILLVALLIACVKICWENLKQENPNEPFLSSRDADESRWVWLGSGVAFTLVWLLGYATRQAPDFDAHVIVVPLTLALSWFMWKSIRDCDSASIDLMGVVCLLAIMLHLMVAGGWTVPGVAIQIWLLGGMLARFQPAESVGSRRSGSPYPNLAIAVFIIGLLLMGALRVMSIGPVSARVQAMRAARYAQAQRQSRASDRELLRAVNADKWASEPCLYRADALHWQVVQGDNGISSRDAWSVQLRQALDRAGENPSLYRAASTQYLHVYQRWGAAEDLAQANQILEQASQWSPTNHWILAQLAVIAAAEGNTKRSNELARQAKSLAKLGSNTERHLSFQLVYRIQHLGDRVSNEPALVPASELID